MTSEIESNRLWDVVFSLRTWNRLAWITGATVGVSIIFYRAVNKIVRIYKQKQRVYPKDTVILHQFRPSSKCPSIDPICQKLETFLRATKIPYMTDCNFIRSRKHKIPWISYNDQVAVNANLAIKFLINQFGIDLNQGMSNLEIAISRAFTALAEERLMWYIHLDRFVFGIRPEWLRENYISITEVKVIRRKVRQGAYYHGYENYNKDQLEEMATENLKALSEFLGTKPYFMGDFITEMDCSISAVLLQIRDNMPGSLAAGLITGRYVNLSKYCDKIRQDIWPDWDNCCLDMSLKHRRMSEFISDSVSFMIG